VADFFLNVELALLLSVQLNCVLLVIICIIFVCSRSDEKNWRN